MHALAGVAWLTTALTAVWSLFLMGDMIDDGNPNTRDGWMGSWLIVIVPTYAVWRAWGFVLERIDRVRRRRVDG
jgi:hypothetical protein